MVSDNLLAPAAAAAAEEGRGGGSAVVARVHFAVKPCGAGHGAGAGKSSSKEGDVDMESVVTAHEARGHLQAALGNGDGEAGWDAYLQLFAQ
jgi:hypothetical protein